MDTECGRPQRRIERRRFVVAGDRVGPVAERAPGRVMAAPGIRGGAVPQAVSPAPPSTAPDAEGVGVGDGGGGGGVVAATGVRTTNASRSTLGWPDVPTARISTVRRAAAAQARGKTIGRAAGGGGLGAPRTSDRAGGVS